jgi:hypothetical protein
MEIHLFLKMHKIKEKNNVKKFYDFSHYFWYLQQTKKSIQIMKLDLWHFFPTCTMGQFFLAQSKNSGHEIRINFEVK